MDNSFRIFISSYVIAFILLLVTVHAVKATTGGPLEELGDMLGFDEDGNGDSSGTENPDNVESVGGSLPIPNITQREEPSAPTPTPSGSVGSPSVQTTDEFAMNAEPHENEFLADDNYWQLDAFGFNVSPNSSICPTGNCEFEFEDGQINTDFSGDWVLTGRLKVGVETEDGTRSTLYDVRGELDRKETLETENSVSDMLGGEFRLGTGSVILPQDIQVEYEITNGTLTVEDEDASLILIGVKQ